MDISVGAAIFQERLSVSGRYFVPKLRSSLLLEWQHKVKDSMEQVGGEEPSRKLVRYVLQPAYIQVQIWLWRPSICRMLSEAS